MKKVLALNLGLSFILVYLIVQMVRVGKIWIATSDNKTHLENETNSLGVERLNLQRQIEFGQTDGFVEQESRNRLNYSREGETVLLLPN